MIDNAFAPLEMDLMNMTHTQPVSVEQGRQYRSGGSSDVLTSLPVQQLSSLPLSVPLNNTQQQQQQQGYGHATAVQSSGGSVTSTTGLMGNPRMMMTQSQPQQTGMTHTHTPIQLQQPSPQQLMLQQQQRKQQQQQLNEPLSEPKSILKAELGGGLSVTLRYRFAAVAVSFAGAHCAYLTVQNNSDHTIR